jgi:hypothetical protein
LHLQAGRQYDSSHQRKRLERSLTARFLVRPKAALRAALDARRRRWKTTQPTKHRHNHSRKNVSIARSAKPLP